MNSSKVRRPGLRRVGPPTGGPFFWGDRRWWGSWPNLPINPSGTVVSGTRPCPGGLIQRSRPAWPAALKCGTVLCSPGQVSPAACDPYMKISHRHDCLRLPIPLAVGLGLVVAAVLLGGPRTTWGETQQTPQPCFVIKTNFNSVEWVIYTGLYIKI